MIEESILFAIGAGILLAIGNNIARAGVINKDPLSGTAISIFSGTILLFLIMIMTNQFNEVFKLDWKSIMYLSISGILGFVCGRSILFYCSKIIGVSRTQVVMSSSIIHTVILGWIILGETLSVKEIAATIIMILGVIMISLSSNSKHGEQQIDKKKFMKGFLIATTGAVLVAIASILIAIVVNGYSSPYSGVFVSYIAARASLLVIILPREGFKEMIKDKKTTKLFIIHGIITGLAQLSRYLAISLGSVVIVQPINLSVNPVVTIILASIFFNKIENINLRVWVSLLLVILGIYLATS